MSRSTQFLLSLLCVLVFLCTHSAKTEFNPLYAIISGVDKASQLGFVDGRRQQTVSVASRAVRAAKAQPYLHLE
jgi:hypothetical protein